MKQLLSKVRAGIEKYNMIQDNDKIAICVSGGKDSMYLLYALNQVKKYFKPNFNIIAIALDPCFDNKSADFSPLENFCKTSNIELIIKRTELAKIIFEIRKEKNPCSLCARMRRGILHSTAKENGCNKIALGHHYDDAIETLLLNLLNNGIISCFSPHTYLSRKDIYMIRPLIFCEENKIAAEVQRLNLPVIKSACHADGNTERESVKTLIKKLEKNYPDLKKKLFHAIQSTDLI